MTDQCPLSEQLDRLFGVEEDGLKAQAGDDLVRLLEARIVQLERQQQVFEEEHRRIVAQLLQTSDALLMEQRSAIARLEQEVADRTHAWKDRAVVLEQARAASAAEHLAAQQRLLTLAYAVDAQMRVVLEAASVIGRGTGTQESGEALGSIRSSVTVLLSVADHCCSGQTSGATGEDAHGTGEQGRQVSAPNRVDGVLTDTDLPFDRIAALDRVNGDEALLKELATLFLIDGPQRISEAKVALRMGDGLTLTRMAHTIKGAAGFFGAVAVTQAASELEELRVSDDLGRVERAYADLETTLGRLLQALTAFVGH